MSYTRVLTKDQVIYLYKNGVPYTGTHLSYVGSRSGSKVANHKMLIGKGGDATSPYSRDDVDYQLLKGGSCSGAIYGTEPGYNGFTESWSGMENVHYSVPIHRTTDLSNDDTKALTRFYEKLRKERSQMNGLQFLGELRESLHMITHPADAIWKGLEQYISLLGKRKKGVAPGLTKRQKASAWKGIIAGTWLEVSFGWKPLLMDTKDIAETVARLTIPAVKHDRVTSYNETVSSDSTPDQTVPIGNSTFLSGTRRSRITTTTSVKYTCGIKMDVAGPSTGLARIAEVSGFTLENFIPTVWELTPYSFLVDYFLNVGDVLNAATTSTVGVTWRCKTTRIETIREASFDSITGSIANYITAPPQKYGFNCAANGTLGKSRIRRVTLVRTNPSDFGIPPLTWSLPGTNTRYANIGALLAGAHPKNFRF